MATEPWPEQHWLQTINYGHPRLVHACRDQRPALLRSQCSTNHKRNPAGKETKAVEPASIFFRLQSNHTPIGFARRTSLQPKVPKGSTAIVLVPDTTAPPKNLVEPIPEGARAAPVAHGEPTVKCSRLQCSMLLMLWLIEIWYENALKCI